MGFIANHQTHPQPNVATLGRPALAKQPGPRRPASDAQRRANLRFATAPLRPLEGEGFKALGGMNSITATNDFVVKFANVNGSGSASANELFAKCILRMGVPVSPRNIFPSNIQGLPTWYEVRVSEQGWLGRRGGYDLLVAMNPQTWGADIQGLAPGGYLFYDNSKPLSRAKFRDDITAIGVPLTDIANRTWDDPRQRQLFKNIMYLGALSVLLGIERDVIVKLIGEQYKGKQALLEPNVHALDLGREYASQNLQPIGLKVERRDNVGDRIFVDGNSAAALGMVYGGATVCAWYPITPSSSLAEAFQKYCAKLRVDPATGKHRYAIVQAEDEIASIGIVTGAGWNGARAFTATSGPGISLMNEFIGLAYFAEIPVTIVDVQRGGPSTGMPTRTQQSDVMFCAHASHGDTNHVLLFPEDPHECFEFAAKALDLADRLQTPVFMLSDLDIGMNHRLCKPFEWDDARRYDRGKVLTVEQLEAGVPFGRYRDVDGDGIPYRTYPGTHPTRGSFFTRGTSKNADAKYSEKGEDYIENMQRLKRKLETAKALLPQPVPHQAPHPARYGAIYFGSTSPSMAEAITRLDASGMHIDALRVRGYPFADSVREFIDAHDHVFVVEQNRDGQLRSLLIEQFEIDPARLIPILHYDGTPITARFISKAIGGHMGRAEVTQLRGGKVA
jgi:2-oxoglutarate ferredoxin oxidoreductase subunit alpha